MIQVDDFHKCYDQTVAVKGISFDVQPGQVLGLIGPNGAGKTTTLRAIAGIIPQTLGRLTVCGFQIDQEPIEAKKRLAYIPDDPQLFHDLTVVEHLLFAAKTYGSQDVEARIEDLLKLFTLEEKANVEAGNLSRGMRQKLAISCAYIHDPRAILFDEPLTGLDPNGIRNLKESIVARAESGASIVISSHLLAMVEDICTHVMILNRGIQECFGPIDQVKQEFKRDGDDVSLEQAFFEATTDANLLAGIGN